MATTTPVLLIGATGYIGGTVLSRLLAHPDAPSLDITALLRSVDKAKKLEAFGVKSVVGSYEETALIEKLSEASHVVFTCSLSDNMDAVQAILKGLKQRHLQTGDVPILIHTSGTGVFSDGAKAKGMYASGKIYDDSGFEDLAKIEPTAPHRDVDLAVMQADEDGYARTYIILPSTVYSIAKTPLTEAGIQNAQSMQIPKLIRVALDRGQAGMVGKGLARKPNIHIDDAADLYIVLYDAIVKNGPDNVDHGTKGYYFGENGEHSWYDISRGIASAMSDRGLPGNAEPTPFTVPELIKYFGSEKIGYGYGANSRARGTHSRALGWKPKYTTQDMFDSIKQEFDATLKSITTD